MTRTAGRFRLRSRAAVFGALACMAAGGALALAAPSASGAPGSLSPVYPVTGNSTWFTGLGEPYGGCGIPQANLDTPDFIALNVYNTPRDYTMYTRPLTGADAAKTGMWDNGHNCGRWVQVTISDYCNGINDGAVNSAFCRNGAYVADKYNGAVLNMIVADSCGDPNGWCRDDPILLTQRASSSWRPPESGRTIERSAFVGGDASPRPRNPSRTSRGK